MQAISNDELITFVNNNIDEFHKNKAQRLGRLGLKTILLNKNPYLFKAKNINTASALVSDLMSAFLSSSEEKLFGDFLEKLAIFVSEKTCKGWKSSAPGIDLEFDNDGVRYLVSIKSGPNWGNSSSMRTQKQNFRNAVTVLKQANSKMNIQPVIGICYGKTKTVNTGEFVRVMGQSFWDLISEDKNLYKQIIEPLGYRAKEHNESYLKERDRLLNLFTKEFLDEFCDDGLINWDKLVEYNSKNLPD